MVTHEQSDGIIPNKQTPPSTSQLGTSTDKWGEVNATTITGTTVSGTTIGAGTSLYKAGRTVPGIYNVTVDLPAGQYNISHGLNNANPVIQVYGSGTNQLYFNGSGAPGVTYVSAASGSGVNLVVITMSAASPGSKVVIVG